MSKMSLLNTKRKQAIHSPIIRHARYWMSPQRTAATAGSTYLHHEQINTSHCTPQMQSGFSGSHEGLGSMFLPLEETSMQLPCICWRLTFNYFLSLISFTGNCDPGCEHDHILNVLLMLPPPPKKAMGPSLIHTQEMHTYKYTYYIC